MLERKIRIATRSSPLALWQANEVRKKIENLGYKSEIVTVETSGDKNLIQPAYSFNITGIFTKQLDISLLNNESDIAVHSLKDVPTKLPIGLELPAVLERGAVEDVILVKDINLLKDYNSKAKIATSSLRRKAQWLSKYMHHETISIRGNVQTRIRKFYEDSSLSGIIFAKAGLERLGLLNQNTINLDWVIPAPSQGIIGITCRSDDTEILNLCYKINHENSFIEGTIERQFLATLMGGCAVPIGALAIVKDSKISFKGSIHSYDGLKEFLIEKQTDISSWKFVGKEFAEEILKQKGAIEQIEIIRNSPFNKTEFDNE
jgi:hydroxymethylbilane synthase